MSVKAKRVFLLGFATAIVLSVAITVPYASAWWNLRLQSREMNVVNVRGEILNGNKQTSLVNFTIVAVYPRAVVEARSDMFVVQLFFFAVLDSKVTELICDEITAYFNSPNWTYTYLGRESLSFYRGTLVDFYHKSNKGNIAPFYANVSLAVDAGLWPPFRQDVSRLLYLTDRIETFPYVLLHHRIHDMNNSLSTIALFFNMTRYPTTFYRFNFPLTVWIAYGASLFIIGVVSVNLLYDRKRMETERKNSQ